jgi:hypothetical protein
MPAWYGCFGFHASLRSCRIEARPHNVTLTTSITRCSTTNTNIIICFTLVMQAPAETPTVLSSQTTHHAHTLLTPTIMVGEAEAEPEACQTPTMLILHLRPPVSLCVQRYVPVVLRLGPNSPSSIEPSSSAWPRSASTTRVAVMAGPTGGAAVKDASGENPHACGYSAAMQWLGVPDQPAHCFRAKSWRSSGRRLWRGTPPRLRVQHRHTGCPQIRLIVCTGLLRHPPPFARALCQRIVFCRFVRNNRCSSDEGASDKDPHHCTTNPSATFHPTSEACVIRNLCQGMCVSNHTPQPKHTWATPSIANMSTCPPPFQPRLCVSPPPPEGLDNRSPQLLSLVCLCPPRLVSRIKEYPIWCVISETTLSSCCSHWAQADEDHQPRLPRCNSTASRVPALSAPHYGRCLAPPSRCCWQGAHTCPPLCRCCCWQWWRMGNHLGPCPI